MITGLHSLFSLVEGLPCLLKQLILTSGKGLLSLLEESLPATEKKGALREKRRAEWATSVARRNADA